MIAKIIDKNTIEIYDLTQFNISAIMHSGQVFRYVRNADDSYSVISDRHKATLFNRDNKIVIQSDSSDFFWNYFDLDTDYNVIKQSLLQYDVIKHLLNADISAGGIRILKGGFFETVISFIISANNNIKRFTKTLNLLAQHYGTNNCFPTVEQLSTLTMADFRTLGCGYRSEYLVKAVQQLKSLDVNQLSKLDNKELNKALLNIAGVGPKVAACIMLFCGSFHRLGIAPVDTWINKAIITLSEKDKEALRHKYAGVAQQYIFYYMQHKKGVIMQKMQKLTEKIEIDVTKHILETERLILRAWKESDLDDFFEYASVEGVGEAAGWSHHKCKIESKKILDMFIKEKEVFAVTLKCGGKAIGSLGIHSSKKWVSDEPRLALLSAKELGFVLSKDYWGQGLIPEAVKAVISLLFNEYKLDAITVCHFVQNDRSRRVIEKCGFEFHSRGTFYAQQLDKYIDDLRYVLYNSNN